MKRFINLTYLLTGLILFDLIMTLFWISGGFARELNPIMRFFIDRSYVLFASMKLGLSLGGLYVLYTLYFSNIGFKKIILKSLTYMNAIYVCLFVYHVVAVLIYLLN